MKDNQIKRIYNPVPFDDAEMRKLADEMEKAISTEYRKRILADERKLEEVLKANGWRKASEVAREIFEEIDELKKQWTSGDINDDEFYKQLYLLERKYTEGEG